MWIRVFLASFQGQIAGSEVLLNNEHWEEAQTLLNSFFMVMRTRLRIVAPLLCGLAKLHF